MADSDKKNFVTPQTMALALTDYNLFTKHKLDGLSICQFANPWRKICDMLLTPIYL